MLNKMIYGIFPINLPLAARNGMFKLPIEAYKEFSEDSNVLKEYLEARKKVYTSYASDILTIFSELSRSLR
jgi:hypothetical protein